VKFEGDVVVSKQQEIVPGIVMSCGTGKSFSLNAKNKKARLGGFLGMAHHGRARRCHLHYLLEANTYFKVVSLWPSEIIRSNGATYGRYPS